jgi:hypothetical protein
MEFSWDQKRSPLPLPEDSGITVLGGATLRTMAISCLTRPSLSSADNGAQYEFKKGQQSGVRRL